MCPRGRPRGQGRPRGLHLWQAKTLRTSMRSPPHVALLQARPTKVKI